MYLYILENTYNHKYYIGTTVNWRRRLSEHNSEQSKYTGRQSGQWELRFLNEYGNTTEAIREEHRLKKTKNRKYISWYIRTRSSIGRAAPS